MKLYIANTEFFNEYDKYFQMMSDKRKESVNRLKFDSAKKQTILGEALARKGLNDLTGIDEDKIIFSRTENGKPFAENADVFFSISHSKDYVVCAVDDNEIGVDIEQIRQVESRITNISCTERDKKYIFGEADSETLTPEMLNRFFEVLTAKEAYFKYIGSGIVGLKTIDYDEIKPQCKKFIECGYVITIYSKQDFHGMKLKIV
ncbi:MAG: 4'-phosphopantetheinyl transferase superfamily protein [Clostridia bacterium]|nr:4'-phosphopantetheinyl transferase superfamily protein [Clostridia bacterium]